MTIEGGKISKTEYTSAMSWNRLYLKEAGQGKLPVVRAIVLASLAVKHTMSGQSLYETEKVTE